MNPGIILLANYLMSNNRKTRIEAEGKSEHLLPFFDFYRDITGQALSCDTDGIVLLADDKNKWNLELRIYISDVIDFPDDYAGKLRTNTRPIPKYRAYAKRINDNELIKDLIRAGLRIGES